MIKRLLTSLACLLIAPILFSQIAPSKTPPEFKLVVNEDFGSSKIPKSIEKSPFGQWIISKEGLPGTALKYIGAQNPTHTDVRPETEAFIKGVGFKRFVLEADLEQCGRDYACRDISIIFNHLDDNNYLFIHLASLASEESHGIFEVKNGVLTMLTPPAEEPMVWGVKQWYQLRIEKDGEAPGLRVFLNNMLMWELTVLPDLFGRVGFGAPDGAAKIDNLKIWAPETSTLEILFPVVKQEEPVVTNEPETPSKE